MLHANKNMMTSASVGTMGESSEAAAVTAREMDQ